MRRIATLAAGACLVSTLASTVAVAQPAQPDSNASSRDRLDRVLVVLRDHPSAAGKPCLDAMTKVHQTEDQVADVTKAAGDSGKSDTNADIARDVLDSDYETAQTACQPDAVRACASPGATAASLRNCAALNRGGPR